ncbi:MAG: response regulator transcription factor [Verrucomicrobiota bacterium]
MIDLTTVVLADDHPVYRAGLRKILETADDIEILAEANDGAEAIKLVDKHSPDILLLDVSMPNQDGIETARICQERSISSRIIFLTVHQEEALIRATVKYGVKGYVLKESVADEIVRAVRSVAIGGEYLSPPLGHLMMREALIQSASDLNLLTKAEKRVLRYVASDSTSKEIASQLGLSVRTVENHRSRMSKKLGLSGAHSLVKFAFQNQDALRQMLGNE